LGKIEDHHPFEKKNPNKIRSLLPKSSKNLRKKIWDTTDSTNEHSISIQLHPAPTKIVASPAVAGTLTVTVFVLKPGEMAPSLALQDGYGWMLGSGWGNG
jgi:hypothetical protein